MKKIILLALLIISAVAAAQALGVSPPIYEFAYTPGETHSFTFYVKNDGPSTYINATVRGSFASAVKIDNEYFFLKSGSTKEVKVLFTMPELKTPGQHITEIFFTQVAQKRYGQPQELSAVVSIVGLLKTRVPFKQKYAELGLSAQDVKRGEKAYFSVDISNYGAETIKKASGSIRVTDEKNSASLTAQLTEILNLPSLSSSTMYSEFGTAGLVPGKYYATAFVDYDGIKASVTKEFRITDILLEVLDVLAPDITKGQIAKVTITLLSKWQENINSFAQIYLKDLDGNIVAETVTPTIKVAPFDISKLVAYLNTNNLPEGIYTVEIIINYSEKQIHETAKITIKESQFKKIKLDSTYVVFVIIIAVLVMLLLRQAYGKRK